VSSEPRYPPVLFLNRMVSEFEAHIGRVLCGTSAQGPVPAPLA
jgi:hypothetical protein